MRLRNENRHSRVIMTVATEEEEEEEEERTATTINIVLQC